LNKDIGYHTAAFLKNPELQVLESFGANLSTNFLPVLKKCCTITLQRAGHVSAAGGFINTG